MIARFARDTHPHLGPAILGERPKEQQDSSETAEKNIKKQQKGQERSETEQRKSLDLIARFARDTHPHLGPAILGERPKEQQDSRETAEKNNKKQQKGHQKGTKKSRTKTQKTEGL